MDRAVRRARRVPDVFHNIDFAAAGPADSSDVVAHHPDRGPNSLASRQLRAHFDAAVLPRDFAQRFDRGGGVVRFFFALRAGLSFNRIFLFDRLDRQAAVFLKDLLKALITVFLYYHTEQTS